MPRKRGDYVDEKRKNRSRICGGAEVARMGRAESAKENQKIGTFAPNEKGLS